MIELVAAAAALIEPMLDGKCGDHVEIAQTMGVAGGVTAYVQQTKDHVWLCFALPPNSHGTTDLRLETPALPAPLNIHASAQLGEWAADDPNAAPKDGASPIWGKVDGWWANVVPLGGLITTAEGRRVNYKAIPGRELQLSKQRFGRGEWKLVATISDVAVPAGEQISVRWPVSGHFTLKVE